MTTKETKKENLKRFDVYLTVYYDAYRQEKEEQELNEGERAFYFEGYDDKNKDKLFLEGLIKFLEKLKRTYVYVYKFDYQLQNSIEKACKDAKKFKTIESLKKGKNLSITILEYDIDKEKSEILDRESGIKNLWHFVENLKNIKEKMNDEISKLIAKSKESKETHDKLISEILIIQKELSAVNEVRKNAEKTLNDEEEALYKIKKLANNDE